VYRQTILKSPKMAFELKLRESLRKAVPRIVRKQLDRASEVLTGVRRVSRDEAVHEWRTSVKKIRAVLRLVRPEIGRKTYSKQNARFREAARPLSEVRDAKILVEGLDKLTERFREQLAGRAFDGIRGQLQADLRAVHKRVLDKQHAFAAAARSIRQARRTIKSWTDVRNRWSSIGQGLRQTYRGAREAYEDAMADASVGNLHQWRKQVKYLRYQLNILRPIWPERMEELINEADQMGQLLGDDHDLAVLCETLTGEPQRFGEASDVQLLLALIDRRRAELQQDASLLAEKFFLDKPRDFERRLMGYWALWQEQAKPQEREQLKQASS